MSLAHIHLVLNHVPVVGLSLAVMLLAYGMLRRSNDVVRAALVGFVALAVLAIPVYLTGEPAEKAIKGHPGIAAAAVEVHERAAGVALAGMELVGVAALIVLLLYRSRSVPVGAVTATLLLACVLGGLMAWTANLGGRIHHTEIATGTGAFNAVHHDD